MKKIGQKVFWFVFAVLFTGLFVVIYLIPGAVSLFERTSVVEYGEIILKTETEAFFVREETVCPESDSSAAYYFEEGDRVRKTSTLFRTGGVDYKAGANGVVSYSVDGLETVLTPETMETIDLDELESLFMPAEMSPDNAAEENSGTGDALDTISTARNKIKLVKEEEWYLLFRTEIHDLENYGTGKTVTVTFEDGDSVPMTVFAAVRETKPAVSEEGEPEEYVRVILKSTRYHGGFQKARRESVTVVTADKTGLLLKNSSICYANNMEGVYVKQVSGDFTFVPVHVLLTDGTHSVVSEGSFTRTTTEGGTAVQTTINAYDEILNSPPKEK